MAVAGPTNATTVQVLIARLLQTGIGAMHILNT